MRYLSHRIGNKRISLGIPVISLAIVTHIINRIKSAKHKGQNIVAHRIDDVGYQKFHAESKHFPHGSEIDMKVRAPSRIIISSDIQYEDEDDLLPSQTPVSHPVECQHQSHDIRTDQSHEINNGYLLVHHIFHHIPVLGDTKRRDEETQEHEARQGGETRLMEEISYQRRTEKEHHIHGKTHQDIKPEHRIIIVVGGFPDIHQCLGKTATLQIARNQGENGEDADNTIIGWRQQARQEDAKEDIEHLGGATVHSSPKQSLGGFFL